jgi:NTP pyrophosphatase (non-canonical NTP hydrolase)
MIFLAFGKMVTVKKDISLHGFQKFVYDVYNLPNDRHFELSEMLNNIQRFGMRGLKGIRKKDIEKTKMNLIISFSWFLSTLNRLHIDLEKEAWNRFPYLCSYCGSCPCICKAKKEDKKIKKVVDNSKKPKSLDEYQKMFNAIYPATTRTLDYAGVHLAEEIGEFSEALMAFHGERKEEDFKEVLVEAADYFSCIMGVFNSLDVSLADELSKLFSDNCHVCHKIPCECSYTSIKVFK